MNSLNRSITSEVWLRDLLARRAVAQGGVICPQRQVVERFAELDQFIREMSMRGYRVAENAGHIVVFCNDDPVRWLNDPYAFPVSSVDVDRRAPDASNALGHILPNAYP